MSERSRFFSFSASGSAVGGILTSPKPLTIPSQAMVALSPSGGFGSSVVENFGIAGLLTVGRATSTAQGDEKQTELTVTVEDVDIRGVVTIERLVLHLVARNGAGAYEAEVSPGGSLIEGLKVYGTEIPLDNRADVFVRNTTQSALDKAYAAGELKGLVRAPDSLGGQCQSKDLDGCRTSYGDLCMTMFPLESGSCPLPVRNGGLRIKDFATVYLGQYRVSRWARQLTMLRLELGCDTEGGLTLGDGSGNGHWDPPY